MDHGVLNIPLSKRGDIDQQLDAYKASQASAKAKVRKMIAECTKANRVTAKALVADTTEARWEELASHAGQSVAAVKKHVTSQAHWQPAFVIRLLRSSPSAA
jgi:hypothetical protein